MATVSFGVLIFGIVLALKCAFSTAHALAVSDSSSSNMATLIYHIMGDLYELQSENKLMAEKIEFLEGKLESQHTFEGQIRDQADKITILEGKTESQKNSAEEQIQDQAEKIKTLERTLQSHAISAQRQIQDQTEKNKLLTGKLELLEASFDKMRMAQATKNKLLEGEMEMLESSLAKIQMPTYAFSAYEVNGTTPVSGATLVFTKTLVNENGAYNTTTGIYIVPCDGIYEFHAILSLFSKNRYISVFFVAGEKSIGKFKAGDDHIRASSSGYAIARLRKGTQVFLRTIVVMRNTSPSTGFLFGDDYCDMNSFSGHLISKQ